MKFHPTGEGTLLPDADARKKKVSPQETHPSAAARLKELRARSLRLRGKMADATTRAPRLPEYRALRAELETLADTICYLEQAAAPDSPLCRGGDPAGRFMLEVICPQWQYGCGGIQWPPRGADALPGGAPGQLLCLGLVSGQPFRIVLNGERVATGEALAGSDWPPEMALTIFGEAAGGGMRSGLSLSRAVAEPAGGHLLIVPCLAGKPLELRLAGRLLAEWPKV